jgi:hypothetical protein
MKSNAGRSISKFIKNLYKDENILSVDINTDMYELPYIIVWIERKKNEEMDHDKEFRNKIIDDVEDYLGLKVRNDPAVERYFGIKPKKGYDAYIDVRYG